jgi:hypothetical protein
MAATPSANAQFPIQSVLEPVLDPFISLEALNALSILLNQLLKTVVPSLNVKNPGACGNSQEKNQGATHDREYEDAADRKALQDGHRCQADGSVRKRGGCRDTKLARSPGRSARAQGLVNIDETAVPPQQRNAVVQQIKRSLKQSVTVSGRFKARSHSMGSLKMRKQALHQGNM